MTKESTIELKRAKKIVKTVEQRMDGVTDIVNDLQ